MRTAAALLLLALGGLWGCARSASNIDFRIRPRQMPQGGVQYEGPMAGPYDSFTEMAETACERMSARPTTPSGVPPLGYCALFFSMPEDSRKWSFSYFASLDGNAGSMERTCVLPEDPASPDDKSVLQLGGASDGPNEHEGLEGDWRPTRLLNQRTATTWDYDVMVFTLEKPGKCSAYAYIAFRRDLTALRDGDWIPVGTLYNGEGIVQALEGR
jgi:hypothetical protein